MPLPPADSRSLLTRRMITCAGYERTDGLLEVDGHLVDLNNYPVGNDWRGEVEPGNPVHEMQVRLTIDDALVIRRIDACTDAAPYPYCRDVTPNLQRLLGLKITGGFKQQMRSLVGHTEGCTHLVTLIEAIATVAIRTLAGRSRSRGDTSLVVFAARDPKRPPLIDTCHSYAADSPVVQKLWPQYYRPRAADPESGPEHGAEGGD